MKALLLALALFASSAFAQITIPNDPCTGKPVDLDTVNLLTMNYGAGNLPECTPIPSLTSTEPHIRVNAAGVLGYGYCKIGPMWRLQYYVATWDFLTSTNIAGNLRAALAAPDALTAFQQLTIASVTSKTSDPAIAAVWCPFVKEMVAGIPPPDLTWVVAPNGTLPDRAAFAVTAGKRSYSSTQRAKVGTPTAPPSITEGTTNYCAVAENVVTVCTKP